MARKKLTAEERTKRRIQTNLRQSIRRAKENKRPLKVGTTKGGKVIVFTGKSAQRERIKIANARAKYQISSQVDHTRTTGKSTYQLNVNKMDFKTKDDYKTYMKYNNAHAQAIRLNDNGNSMRQSFMTKAQSLGVSKRVLDKFEERFDNLSNQELLATVNKAVNSKNLTFDDIFDSDQEVTDIMQMKQLQNMMKALDMEDELEYLRFDDINSGYVSNENFAHYDYEQADRKVTRNLKGLV